MQRYGANPRHAFLVLAHHTDGLVLVTIDLELGLAGQVNEREHVTTGNCRDECFFGINIGGIAHGHRHNRWR